jgi:hypothetical protein
MLVLAAVMFSAGCNRRDSSSGSPPPNSGENEAAQNAPGSEATSDPGDPQDVPTVTAPIAPAAPVPITLPAGKLIQVRLLQNLNSRSADPGQSFEAELATPLASAGNTVFPQGSLVRGRVVDARPSGRLQKPGYLSLTLDSIRMNDGKWVAIQTSHVSVEGTSHKKRNLTMIGGGAGLGGVIGAIAGGGKGAAIGAAAGAGAGTAGAYATGKKDVGFSTESNLSFKLSRTLEISGS